MCRYPVSAGNVRPRHWPPRRWFGQANRPRDQGGHAAASSVRGRHGRDCFLGHGRRSFRLRHGAHARHHHEVRDGDAAQWDLPRRRRGPHPARDPGRLFVREHAIGEGDLKLPAVRLQHAALAAAGAIPSHVMASPTSEAPHVAVCVTIDSDAYPIELIRHGTHGTHGTHGAHGAHGAAGGVHLALYERSTEKDKPGSYLVCNVKLLHQKILERTWGISRASTLALTDQRATMTMFAAAWSLCGCDFIHPFGMRVKQAESAVLNVLRGREARRALDAMATVWSDASASPATSTATASELVEAPAVKILQYIAELTAREMRSAAECKRVREATLTRVGDPGDAVLLRALWVASYWNDVLHRNAAAFGFGLSSA